jgi:plasmid maintenance system killer protein
LEVFFDDPDLAEACASEKELRKKCGMVRAKKIQQRIKDLKAAGTLADMKHLPGRCHELKENLAGLLSLDLDHPYRLLFRPVSGGDPGPGGGLDWSTVTAVAILSVTDTHK